MDHNYRQVLLKAIRFPGLWADQLSIDKIIQHFSELKWSRREVSGGSIAFAVICGNKETGELRVLTCIEQASYPKHEHLPGGEYGEFTFSIAGTLQDVTDEGESLELKPGMHIAHKAMTTHVPFTNGFWFGYYHQPRGSRLVQ